MHVLETLISYFFHSLEHLLSNRTGHRENRENLAATYTAFGKMCENNNNNYWLRAESKPQKFRVCLEFGDLLLLISMHICLRQSTAHACTKTQLSL